jgi:hypothetical protein
MLPQLPAAGVAIKRFVLPFILVLDLSGCASLSSRSPYVGRPIAEAVRVLGPPDSVADYQSGGRYFGWSISDVRVQAGDSDNPANWLDPMTRANAPSHLAEDQRIALPDYNVSPPFRPWLCSLTLVAEWDSRTKAWIARKAIRRGASKGGHCGMRAVAE